MRGHYLSIQHEVGDEVIRPQGPLHTASSVLLIRFYYFAYYRLSSTNYEFVCAFLTLQGQNLKQ